MRGVVKHGIAPKVLASQVTATAAWALDGPLPPAAVVRDAEAIEAQWTVEPGCVRYFELLLAAHFLTVGTFCPTDVDARIRHHAWSEIEDPEVLAAFVASVDAVAELDPRPVSARVLDVASEGPHGHGLSGHDGEWFSVRAGALGRAYAIGAPAIAERVLAAIDEELVREAAAFDAAVASGETRAILTTATVLAHNLGDLSRVVEAWPKNVAAADVRARLSRLGHLPDRALYGGAFFVAGAVNKSVMAVENHRFLALRKPRSLRQSRALLLPIGPFFEPWGHAVARALEEPDRAEVVEALLETHLRGEDQLGVLRALRGMAEAGVGPWDRVIERLPARLRKIAGAGAVAAGMRITDAAFRARLDNRARAALDEARAHLRGA